MPHGHSSVSPRVLILAPDLSPGLLELLRHLDQLGLRQTIVTGRGAGAPGGRRLGERMLVRRVGLPWGGRARFRNLAAAAELPRLGRIADLVHVHDGDPAFVGLAVATAVLWDIPAIVSAEHTNDGAGRAVEARPFLRSIMGAALRRAHEVIAFSPGEVEGLVAAGAQAGQVRVLPDADQRAAALLDLYRAVWTNHLARQVAVWHPTIG